MSASDSTLLSFGIYMALVFLLAGLANVERGKKRFLNEYFLGSRNIGLWAFAFTYAATAASGGSFMGFPSLIYSHGWALAWWIAGYMVVPLVALGLFAKRINQVARLAGAITVPEMLRRRFDSAWVGNTATLLVIFFMFFYLLAQFKAGAEIMGTLLEDVEVYRAAVVQVETSVAGIPWVNQAEGDYLICLVVFAIAVILYTAWGGFRAVVWTDVMQGIVMGVGVVILLVLTLHQVGGLPAATRAVAAMTTPEFGEATLMVEDVSDENREFLRRIWIQTSDGGMVRLKSTIVLPAGQDHVGPAEILKLTTPSEIEKVRPLAEAGVMADFIHTEPYASGAGEEGVYLTAPGPHRVSPVGFLTVGLAFSFFAFWNFSGAGQPSYMVRQMAFRDTVTLRRSILMVAGYFSLIYFPLVIIFTCARVLLPGMEIQPDRIMPELATAVSTSAGLPWLAGLLVAAPFAAVMSSVDSYLLLVSSGVVRDVYQQSINPSASEKTMKLLSYTVTAVLGILAVLAVLNPPPYLQTLIVFASGGLGASFLMPMILCLYWPRMTAAATVAAMLTGTFTILSLYLVGYVKTGHFGEYNLLGLHPFIWACGLTFLVIVTLSWMTPRVKTETVERYFGR